MKRFTFTLLLFSILAGCTQHPAGEMQLRKVALIAGKPYEKPFNERTIRPLPRAPGQRDLINYALRNSPAVQQAYWNWRSAIEEIPQAGTEPTTVMLNAGTLLTNGTASLANSTLGASNMGSADIRWPSKMSVQARRAYRNALAAEWQFQLARFAVRRNVLNAWYRYIQATVRLHLTQRELQIVRIAVSQRSAGIGTGGSVGDWLADKNRLDALQLKLADRRQKVPRRLALLNSQLDRPADAPIQPPTSLPAIKWPQLHARQILRLAVMRNPELRRLRELQKAEKLSIRRARMQFIPNFDLGISTSLDGSVQNLTGSLVAPIFQYQAIDASIAQAKANLRAVNAQWRGKRINLDTSLIIDLLLMRRDRRQLAIYSGAVLPRLKFMESIARTNYQQGQAGIENIIRIESLRVKIRSAILDVQADALGRLADIQAIIAAPLKTDGPQGPPAASRKKNRPAR